ncbi:MAG: hypothetical protein ACAI35_17110 [Candidatus Methylacidiphilales bacterium]|nr:hypothetical protein [Candidatus Methylacidiphilales bacterium]
MTLPPAELLGHFDLEAEERTRSLELTLEPPPHAAIDRGFCDLISRFLSDYAGRLHAENNPSGGDFADAVCYLANELLENAVKYRCGGPVQLGFCLQPAHFVLVIRNEMLASRAPEFRQRVQQMLESDPTELLMEQAERNAADPDSHGSGIGFLTLLTDYGALLGWKLQHKVQDAGTDQARITLTTMASLVLGNMDPPAA